ncbi:inositol monophosphatase family protein [Actinocrinis sp.]|uniref:inositol monophosphatase family protein n=1 Tax=Actinocrinis sp. TaxID=1920516 RepID=UPI002D478A83|nr:inositol monophosphatase family protein [Actinocrinis sp.]HZP51197.1 inositol monophosphatase family protein [Actinocrinis sp.]
MTPDPWKLLELARAAASEAARLAVERRPADLGVADTKSSPTDVVTEMDTAAEALIRELILEQRPDDAFLGEEGGADSGRGAEMGHGAVRWVIDPIDGTVNYLYDLPHWSVSVGVEVDGVTVAGVVTAPRLGEVYTAVRGAGAWCNDTKLRVRPATDLGSALVATGFGYRAERRERQGAIAGALLPRVRDIRRNGSAALDLCAVAAGRLDGYYERGTHHWDRCAGTLIAIEAGAVVEGFHGAVASEQMSIAAPHGTFSALHDALVELGADDDDY